MALKRLTHEEKHYLAMMDGKKDIKEVVARYRRLRAFQKKKIQQLFERLADIDPKLLELGHCTLRKVYNSLACWSELRGAVPSIDELVRMSDNELKMFPELGPSTIAKFRKVFPAE